MCVCVCVGGGRWDTGALNCFLLLQATGERENLVLQLEIAEVKGQQRLHELQQQLEGTVAAKAEKVRVLLTLYGHDIQFPPFPTGA